MAVKWIGTKFKGVRYYEHPTRKHGVKKDRYLAIRYQKDGKRIEEGIGWTSERDPEDNEFWTETKAVLVLERLKGAAKHGTSNAPTRIAEKREIEKRRKETERQERELKQRDQITFKEYFDDTYYPTAKTHKKKQSYIKEEAHFRLWLEPEMGRKPLKTITHLDIQRVKKKMLEARKSPRYIQYVMATARQVWNAARKDGLVNGDSPTRSVKVPKFDNRRQRFLSMEEANILLNKLREKNEQIYRMAFLSLHTGMRASEIFNLTWGCIDTDRGLITILDAKSGKGRPAFMTEQVKAMFLSMKQGKHDDLVFPHSKGKAYSEIPTLFRDVVAELKFNDHVSDPRQRVCFHSLRHSFGSWHAESGTDIYVIKELLGHGSITLTERYSHLTKGSLQNATKNLEQTISKAVNEQDVQVATLTTK
ncbi:MAG: Tyrosine recombinase XerC [Syntrophus sp. SKADARSKE-3]|nr:Tyrosine recombinase XerC [Syntrophus sp. SKADARSKE-3]